MDYLKVVSELNYMTQIVIMLYEDPNKVTVHLFLGGDIRLMARVGWYLVDGLGNSGTFGLTVSAWF